MHAGNFSLHKPKGQSRRQGRWKFISVRTHALFEEIWECEILITFLFGQKVKVLLGVRENISHRYSECLKGLESKKSLTQAYGLNDRDNGKLLEFLFVSAIILLIYIQAYILLYSNI